VALIVKQNIFRFQITVMSVQWASTHLARNGLWNAPIDDIERMKVLKGTEELGSVEPRPYDIKATLSLQVIE
jgi:hypothetical protein